MIAARSCVDTSDIDGHRAVLRCAVVLRGLACHSGAPVDLNATASGPAATGEGPAGRSAGGQPGNRRKILRDAPCPRRAARRVAEHDHRNRALWSASNGASVSQVFDPAPLLDTAFDSEATV